MTDLVSIVMPNYNTASYFLTRAINSVLEQTYANWELLITDDGSSDESRSIINAYAEKDARIKLFNNALSKGPAGARNTSIDKANGRFIAFLDSDDQWLPFHLSERILHMLENEYYFTYSWYKKSDEEGRNIGQHTPEKDKASYQSLLTDNYIGCLTAIYDTKHLSKIYMPDIKKRQDFALWLQILKTTQYAYLYPKITAIYTVRKASVSSRKLKLVKYNWAIYRDVEHFSTIKSSYFFSIFLYKYFKRKLLR